MDDFASVAHKDSDSWIDEAAKDLAERDLLALAAMPEKNPDPILEIALDGALTFCNAAARRAFPNILVEGHSHAVLRGMFACIDRLTAGISDEETRIVTAAGSMWEQRFVFHPVSRRVRVFHHDVTALKRLEKENQELKQQLDQLRMQTFHNAQTLDHELRSELNIIIGYAQLLSEAAREKTDLDPAQLTPYIEFAGERISELLDAYTLTTDKDAPVPGGTVDIPLAVLPAV
ncbi:MAG: hypothetical protein HY962_08060 [Ignavibacteriae bacterium]|nr:hypothetical protein [Ignavibacteriota bacterium]